MKNSPDVPDVEIFLPMRRTLFPAWERIVCPFTRGVHCYIRASERREEVCQCWGKKGKRAIFTAAKEHRGNQRHNMPLK